MQQTLRKTHSSQLKSLVHLDDSLPEDVWTCESYHFMDAHVNGVTTGTRTTR